MIKFGRNYSLTIAVDNAGGTLVVEPPFTIEFDITRVTLASRFLCQIKVYNLSEIHRNLIKHNRADYGGYKGIDFRAGYGNNLADVFQGNISAAYSSRVGTDFITTIECYDGGYGYANGEINLPFAAGTPLKAVITAIASTLKSKSVTIGAIGDYPGVLSRGNTYSGNTMKILTELTGGGAFIDNRKFYALGTNEYVLSTSNTIGVINSQSGLLGTPELEGGDSGLYSVRFEMLFEPGLTVGRKITLDSSSAADIQVQRGGSNFIIGPAFNGDYIVKSVKHRGMISGAVCGTATTTGTFTRIKQPIGVAGH